MREQQRREREEKDQVKKSKQEARAKVYLKKEEERLAREKAKAEEEAKRLEEEKKKEKEEFDDWRSSFSVETSGSQAQEAESQNQRLLTDFVKYIKTRKVAPLDEIAGEFNLNTEQVVERIKTLEQNQELTGLIDDRGKYIYITPSELDAIAAFIKKRGRVTVNDLVTEANSLINLTPSDSEVTTV